MSIELVLGGLLAFIITVLGAFFGGKSSGKKSSLVSSLKTEIKIRKQYEKIDNAPNVDDPLSVL